MIGQLLGLPGRAARRIVRPLRMQLPQPIGISEYISRAARVPRPWVALSSKMHSLDAARALIAVATGGSLTLDGILQRPRSIGEASLEGRQVVHVLDALLAAAVQDANHALRRAVSELVVRIRDEGHALRWSAERVLLTWQLLTLDERDDLLDWLAQYSEPWPQLRWSSERDAQLRGALQSTSTSHRREQFSTWWDDLNSPLVEEGLEPWELAFDEIARNNIFRAIHAPDLRRARATNAADPMVSVIVPVFNPDESFRSTVESLVNQSWHNLEIIIVDDASTTGGDHIDAAGALDSRIRILHQTENAGAYVARNRGFAAATGEFVTVLDADDLSHPRRIEIQVNALRANPEAQASVISAIRMYAAGQLTSLGFHATRMNYSSALFRRERLRQEFGEFDRVRKSGDIEFLDRIKAVHGDTSVIRDSRLLSLVQLTAGSLSRDDSGYVWLSGDRLAYRYQYQGWHARQLEGSTPTPLRLEAGDRRPFVAPAVFLRDVPRTSFGAAILRDWTHPVDAGLGKDLIDALLTTVESPVGLISGVEPRSSTAFREPADREITDAVDQGRAEWLPWNREASVETLLISDPEYLCILPEPMFRALQVSRVWVLRQAPFLVGRFRAVTLDESWVEQRVFEVFGCHPTWVQAPEAPGQPFT